MDYKFQEFTIRWLVDLIDNSKVDLSPSYQRNFIWSPLDQSHLIDTILKGYPLPNFFIFCKPDGKFEMVDGQQRSRTIYRFIKGSISASIEQGKKNFSDLNQKQLLEYRLPFIVISNLLPSDSLREFYVLINKKGKHLNVPEINKSEFHDTNFMKLADEALNYQNFINLDLFSEATSKRMNDRAFVEELLAYIKFGIRDKKNAIEAIYDKKEDIQDSEYETIKNQFCKVIDIIHMFNSYYPIKQTRYKQKNDFYTLFNFIYENMNTTPSTLLYQYKILLVINRSDQDNLQFIRPSNEECDSFREYANNCVTQSNSKSAREKRLSFFNALLKNKDFNKNPVLLNVIEYLTNLYGSNKIDLVRIGDFQLLNVELL